MATRKEVAELAGVSPATVTYVLNRTKKLSPEVEERVRTAAKQLDYTANKIASSLVTRRSTHLAMVVDHLDNPYYCTVLKGAQAAAMEKGYIISALMMDSVSNSLIEQLSARGVDGVYIALERAEQLPDAEKLTMPIMYADEVSVDFTAALWDVVAQFKAMGHKRVAFISGTAELSQRDKRYMAFRSAMEQQDMMLEEELMLSNQTGLLPVAKTGYEMVKALLKSTNEFTGLFAHNDLMAMGAIQAVNEAGLRVPEDISVVGCDNLDYVGYLSPPIASVDTRAYDVGRTVAEVLIAKVEGNEKVLQPLKLFFVPRASLGKAKR